MKTALCIGGGKTVWDDIQEAYEFGAYDYVIVCNTTIADFPGRIDIAITLHPGKLDKWLKARAANGYSPVGKTVSYTEHKGVVQEVTPYKWPNQKSSGSSGLYCVKYALLDLKCDLAVLAGIPMDEGHAHYHTTGAWKDCAQFMRAWTNVTPELMGRVKSMSGWTREKFGAPTKEWLNGDSTSR